MASAKLEDVGRVLGDDKTLIIGRNTADIHKHLLQDTLALYLGMGSPGLGQPAAGPAAAYRL